MLEELYGEVLSLLEINELNCRFGRPPIANREICAVLGMRDSGEHMFHGGWKAVLYR